MNKEIKKTNDGNDKDVSIVIEVTQDKVEAYITLIPLTESPKFSVDEIRKALSEKGIKFGIKEEVLVTLESEVKYREKILIASGLRPKEGKEGEISCFFDSGKIMKIKKGDKIAEFIPPEESTEGMTVYEDKIPAPKDKQFNLPNFVNVEISPENANLVISGTDGYLTIEQSSIMVSPFFELKEITDQYEANIKVINPLNDGDFTSEDLKKFLGDNKIVFGIKGDEIEKIFQEEKFGQRILIAEGKRVVDGKDGEIKYYFKTEVKPTADEQGNVNFKELSLIQNVEKGAKLAEVIPPQKGIEGCNIFGAKIPPKEGLPTVLPTGKNANPDPNKPNIIIAEIDGNVKLKGKNIEVDPVFIVKENVDFSTGNIDYIGSVIVNGDVKSGFSVKAKDNVQVNGVVEDTTIEAGGDVLLKTGFIGDGDGKIISQGNVMVKFCENENIVCEGDVLIGDYVMHSNIQTRGNLIVTEQKGLILGGEIYALKGIEAKTIGNESYTPTSLFVGVDKEITNKIKEKKTYLAKNIENRGEIEKTLESFSQKKLIKKTLSEDKNSLLEKLNKTKEKLEEDEKNIVTEIEELEKKLDEFKNAIVKIIDVVYPGTSITISNKHITVKEPIKYVYYKYSEKELVAEDLGELK
ncbi:flagellar assembly protein A [candidate division KSB1 bacterium]